MLLKILLWINISLLYVHEMDAAYAREWRMMLFFKNAEEETGHRIFTGLHFIFFLGIFWLMWYRFMLLFLVLNIFLILHLFLHIIFRKHYENRLNNRFSLTIVILMFLVSCISLVLLYY